MCQLHVSRPFSFYCHDAAPHAIMPTIHNQLHSAFHMQPQQRIAGHGRAPTRGVANTGIVGIAPSFTWSHLICGLEDV